MKIAYKYRLYPTKIQKSNLLNMQLGKSND